MERNNESNENKNKEEKMNQYISEYIESLDETEKLILEIAREHLESSFCIERSVGFVKWLKEREKEMENK